ncbi:hypothetical protein SAMN05421505_1556 [Sinosporangium album]|uniref:Uncharacterized protein n=1 Tax=Sinosporangium album TaxID=504805 RepID=A0A1G8KTN3_9ACTN|nr:hypothetical protein [Sinosporangium album]SDI46784.1 hypothetical protein SAMN05421505_1556 [Sinosporangium album]
MADATTPVQVRVPYGTRGRLTELLRIEKARRAEILAERFAVPADEPAAARARIRAAARAHVADLRRRGELTDTVDVAMRHAVQAELRERGWDHAWPPPPPTAPSSGRWPGSRDAGYPEVIPIRLPVSLAERVQSACAHVSAPAITALRAWRDANPGKIHDSTAQAEYDRLAAEVVTPGDVLRAAVARVLPAETGAQPPG